MQSSALLLAGSGTAPVGNPLTYSGPDGTKTYAYDAANRLTSVNGVVYTWDDNGNPSTGSGQAC